MLIKTKTLMSAFLTAIVVFVLMAGSEAKVTGVCVNCHTMHNSQNGSAVAYDFNETSFTKTDTPKDCLLIYSCLGCHSATDSGGTWQHVGAPVVFNTVGPITYGANGLAGGNFYYVSGIVDNTGHNVLSNTDDTPPALGNTPPGGTVMTSQLTCAGEFGCHGDRSSGKTNITGLKGAHHTSDSTIDGSNVGKSYRFLNGILGKEDTDWEQDNINTSHNEYKGAIGFTVTTTISYLCGECHGNFHSSAGVGSTGASPWLRHPTDIALKITGEYASYTTYSMVAPVARPNPDSVLSTSTVYPGTDIIMCLSCHRAHASPNFKMMRWNYKSTTLLSATPVITDALYGCVVCHTSKN